MTHCTVPRTPATMGRMSEKAKEMRQDFSELSKPKKVALGAGAVVGVAAVVVTEGAALVLGGAIYGGVKGVKALKARGACRTADVCDSIAPAEGNEFPDEGCNEDNTQYARI